MVETGSLNDLADIQSLVANVSRVADEITRDALAGPKEEQYG